MAMPQLRLRARMKESSGNLPGMCAPASFLRADETELLMRLFR